MDLRLLEIFCNVYQEQSFSKAARRLGLTQPTVSSHIKALEESLGTRLFDRLGREIEPTEAGRFLFEHGRPIIDAKEALIERLGRFLNRLEGELRLGASTIPGEYLLPAVIARFQSAYPSVRATLRIEDTRAVVEGVRSGRLHLGFAGARIHDDELEYKEIARDRLVLAVPANTWQGRERITLEELTREPLLVREVGSGTRMILEHRLEKEGLSLESFRIAAELGSTSAIKEAIKAGFGVSFVSERALDSELAAGILKVIEVVEMEPTVRRFYTVLHRRRARSPLAEAFLDFLAASPLAEPVMQS